MALEEALSGFLNKKSKIVIALENSTSWYSFLLEDKKHKNLTPIFVNNEDDFVNNTKLFEANVVFLDCDSN